MLFLYSLHYTVNATVYLSNKHAKLSVDKAILVLLPSFDCKVTIKPLFTGFVHTQTYLQGVIAVHMLEKGRKGGVGTLQSALTPPDALKVGPKTTHRTFKPVILFYFDCMLIMLSCL